MAMSEIELRLAAVERYFQNARQAEIKDYWARFTGKKCSLLKYEDVAKRLHIRQQIPIGHKMVLLDHIVGSVGRYREFTKEFLPRATVMQDRWVAVDAMMNSLKGLPPVDLYKIGEAYFVVDGNHRISVSRANGNKDIEANVIECQTSVALTLEDFQSDKWLIKTAYSEFLAQTQLTQHRPAATFDVSSAAFYQTLLQHIAVHRYLCNRPRRQPNGAWRGQAVSWSDAVISWYDTVYMPIVEAIRAHQVHAKFPQRTETDLYIAITQYRERVAEQYELAPLGVESAVNVFAANHSDGAIGRIFLALRQAMIQRAPWGLGQIEMPMGMTTEEFAALRLRHDAGEMSVAEAERKQKQEPLFTEALCEGAFGV